MSDVPILAEYVNKRMIVMEKQGQVLVMRNLSIDILSPATPQKRGNVTEFSQASRRRLIDLTARLDIDGTSPKFLTLTFSGIPHPDRAKICFRNYVKRLRRYSPFFSAVWRVEMQKRGSPHFHLIIFNFPYVEQSILRAWWMQCTGEEKSGVNITSLKNSRQVMYYVSKYVAKHQPNESSTLFIQPSYLTAPIQTWEGRHWGIINKEGLPYAKREICIVRDEEIERYFRWYRATIYVVGSGNPLSLRLYSENAQAVFDAVQKMSIDALKSDDFERPQTSSDDRRAVKKRFQKFFGIRAKGIVKFAQRPVLRI